MLSLCVYCVYCALFHCSPGASFISFLSQPLCRRLLTLCLVQCRLAEARAPEEAKDEEDDDALPPAEVEPDVAPVVDELLPAAECEACLSSMAQLRILRLNNLPWLNQLLPHLVACPALRFLYISNNLWFGDAPLNQASLERLARCPRLAIQVLMRPVVPALAALPIEITQ